MQLIRYLAVKNTRAQLFDLVPKHTRTSHPAVLGNAYLFLGNGYIVLVPLFTRIPSLGQFRSDYYSQNAYMQVCVASDGP